jgi:hypothetical protein
MFHLKGPLGIDLNTANAEAYEATVSNMLTTEAIVD